MFLKHEQILNMLDKSVYLPKIEACSKIDHFTVQLTDNLSDNIHNNTEYKLLNTMNRNPSTLSLMIEDVQN